MGAPLAPALPSQAANRTGGLFACPLTPELSDCWRVPIDEGGEVLGPPPLGAEGMGGTGMMVLTLPPPKPSQLTCRERAKRTSGWG